MPAHTLMNSQLRGFRFKSLFVRPPATWLALSDGVQKRGHGFRWPFRIRRFLSVPPPPVDYALFATFLADKDEALRASFERIDSNGDGHIGLWELEKGLEVGPPQLPDCPLPC